MNKTPNYAQYKQQILKSFLIVLLILLGLYGGAIYYPSPDYADKIVIAHRGASGYLLENSLAAKALAHQVGADYIEQDLVMTQDNHIVVFHDLTLNRLTNVKDIFPATKRKDGQYYVIDFSLAQLQQLTLNTPKKISSIAKHIKQDNKIHTLEEELDLIQKLNQQSNKKIGIYPEIKAPWFFQKHNKDISLAVLKILKRYGYTSKKDKIYLQSFDANELQRIYHQLFPQLNISLKLTQLVAKNDWLETFTYNTDKKRYQLYDYRWILSQSGIKKLANYADAIGLEKSMIIKKGSGLFWIKQTSVTQWAHKAGLLVHAYTFDTDQQTSYAINFADLLQIFYQKAKVDAIFTNQPNQVLNFLGRRQ